MYSNKNNINNNNNGIILLLRLRKRKRSHNESLPTSSTTTTSSSSSSSSSIVSFRTKKQVGRRRWILLHISITFVATTMLCTTLQPRPTAAMKYMNHNNMLDIRRMVRMPPKRRIVVLQPPPLLECGYPQQWFHFLQRGGGNRIENEDDDIDVDNDDELLLPVSDEYESSLNDDHPSIQERPSKEESVKTNRHSSNNDTDTAIKGKHQQPHGDLESKETTATVVHESDADEDSDEVEVGVTHDSDNSIRLSDIAPQKDTSVTRQSSSTESSIPLQHLTTQQSLQQPNSIYRFLLRQGHYGAVIVMCFVFLTEWLTLYVPPIMKLLLWIMSHIIPYTNVYYNNNDDDHTSIYRRKKMSRKERKLQTKYDDAMALQQLQRLENKKAVIYRYVSDDFLQRHAIGPYSKTKLETLQDVTKYIRKTNPTKKFVEENTEMDVAEEEEEEDDIDWVVEALTAKQLNKQNDLSQRPLPVVQPSITIGIGSNQLPSIEMGLSIDFGTSKMKQIDRRRNVIAKAITAETKIRRPSSSNNGNTDSILDKFRAVTGTDSVLLSRTLLGAYPGDAVPISEAANPKGVMELAQKYGYGDWSDDDDDTDDNDDMTVVSPTKKTTKTKQRKKKLKPLVHVLKESNVEDDLWKKRDTAHSSQSKSLSLSFSVNSNSDRERQQHPPHLKPRRSNIANDKLGNDRSVIRNADVPPSPLSSSIILQRHHNNNNKFPTKSTKVHAATELLSNKRKELHSHIEE